MDSNEKEPLLIEPSPDTSGSDASLGFQKSPSRKSPKMERLNKPPRKRSRIACTWCRDRKVRCDASSHGVPCTNCELDQQECVVRSASQSVRTKKPGGARREPYPSPPSTFKPSVFQSPQTSSRSPWISHAWSEGDNTSPWNTPPLAGPASSTTAQFGPVSDVFYSFHPFLKLPGLIDIPPEDTQYLNLKGCFQVPSGATLDEFVRTYFLYVHPCLPIINEAEFWQIYYHQSTPGTDESGISLFTFQAMLFASCSFVSSKAIKSAGFADTRTARNALYTRAKLLYDLGCEKSILSTTQGSLLLTYQSSSMDLHAGSLWLSIAIQNAIVYGALHPTPHPKQDNVKGRIWWSILLRDRIIALGLRRHPQITPQTLDLTGRSCVTPLGETDLEDEITHSEVYDPETKRLLARVLVIQCELAMVFTEVLVLVHSGAGVGIGAGTGLTGLMGMGAGFGQGKRLSQTQNQPEGSKQTLSTSTVKKKVANCKAALLRWSTNAKAALGTVVNSHMTHESVSLYFGLTFFYYHAARLALCNFEALSLELNKSPSTDAPTVNSPAAAAEEAEADYERIQDELEDATGCITDTIKRFLAQGMAHHLPISTIPLTAHPLLLSALDVKLSSTKSQSATRKRRFRYYANLMQVYQHRYDGTDTVAAFIQQTLQVADYILPLHTGFGVGAQRARAGIEARAKSGTEATGSAQGTEPGSDTATSGGVSTTPTSWSELFADFPKLYLRLSLALDYAFSRGYFPAYTEMHELLGGSEDGGGIRGLDSVVVPDSGYIPPASAILASDMRASPTNSDANSNPDVLPPGPGTTPNLVSGTGQMLNLTNLYTLLAPEHQQPQSHPQPQPLPSQHAPVSRITEPDAAMLDPLAIQSYNPVLEQYGYPAQLSFPPQDYSCGIYTLRDAPLLDENGSPEFLNLGSSASEYSDGASVGITVGMVEEGVVSVSA
ncbi:hypothetical protein BJY01DRAFT_255256 [Aspergillus pseudoustus]|uniref:Zn(2)-C6 fungal-type domain-containing protein n=1 Tax=Aspergillus pseudoustus TaxID=1810923 RepID=A0ABR4ILZ7_9EURO